MKLNSFDKSEQMKSSLETIRNESAKIETGLFYLKYYRWLKNTKIHSLTGQCCNVTNNKN